MEVDAELPTINSLSANATTEPLITAETVLGFRVGKLGFLLPISLHCEVIERLVISPIPKVEPWFSGLLNIRGNIVPVIDLHLLLGETVNHQKKRHLLAIDRGEKTIVLWIDDYPQLLADFEKPLPTLSLLSERLQACVADTYWHNDQLWLKVHFEQLFKTLSHQRVA